MDETNTFILDPEWEATPAPAPVQATTPAPSSQPVSSGFTLEGTGFEAPNAPAQPPVSTLEDIKRTAAAQAVKGAADAPGMMSGALYYANKAIPKSPEVRAAEVEKLSPEQQMDVEEGKAMPFFGSLSAFSGSIDPRISTVPTGTLPTMAGTQDILEERMPFTKYEAQGRIADILGSGVRAFTGTVSTGSPFQAPTAAVAGSIGRAAGLGVEELSGSSGFGAGTELGTNIAVDFLARKIGNVAYDLSLPNNAAFEKISEGIRAELSKNPQKKALLMQAIAEGRDVKVNDLMNDFLDQKTKAWMLKNLPGDYADSIIRLHGDLEKRTQAINDFTDQEFTKIFGEDLSNNGWQKTLAKAQADEVKNLYGQVRANPAASNIFTPELQKMIGQGGVVQKAAIEVAEAARKGELGDTIVPLAIRAGVKGKPIIQGNTQPNFDYWDQVKRNLDAKAQEAYKAENKFQGDIYKNAAKRVRDSVSDVVGEYPEAREAGQRAIQTPTSLEEGYNFGRGLTATKPNLESIDDFLNQYDRYNPEQKMRVQQGVGRALLQTGETGDFRQISRLMSSRGTRMALTEILGPEKFNKVYGTIAKNALMKTTTEVATAINNSSLREKASKNPIFRDLAIAATGGGGAAGAATYLKSPEAMATGVFVAALASSAFLAKAGLNAKERRVASEVMRLSTSTDPADAVKLGNYLSSDASAVTAIRKIIATSQDAVRSGLLTAARQEDRNQKGKEIDRSMRQNETDFFTPDTIEGFNEGQASGGRVERKAGGRVANAIASEVNRTRALLSNKTASMLSMPDDAIVTALNHAKNS